MEKNIYSLRISSLRFSKESVPIFFSLEYLFSQKSTGDGTKFEDILKDLRDVYSYKKDGKDYSDYKLFITGHSLGGALSSLVSVALAGCDICETYPAMIPVTAITYASPRVGGKAFKKTHMVR